MSQEAVCYLNDELKKVVAHFPQLPESKTFKLATTMGVLSSQNIPVVTFRQVFRKVNRKKSNLEEDKIRTRYVILALCVTGTEVVGVRVIFGNHINCEDLYEENHPLSVDYGKRIYDSAAYDIIAYLGYGVYPTEYRSQIKH